MKKTEPKRLRLVGQTLRPLVLVTVQGGVMSKFCPETGGCVITRPE